MGGRVDFTGGKVRRGGSGGVLMVVWLWCFLISVASAARLSTESRQNLQVENHLNRLNKPPVKSIKVCFLSHSFLVLSLFSLSKSLSLFILCLFGWWESEGNRGKVKGKCFFFEVFARFGFFGCMNKHTTFLGQS